MLSASDCATDTPRSADLSFDYEMSTNLFNRTF